ncbi:MAG: carbonic anhydrase [Phycisphaerae bacterium]|nr:carbonic anhydrase [Phycisphaerae bacterium]
MSPLSQLFENNRKWAESMRARDPAYFERLAAGQSPEYLWIGCSDSRVPPCAMLGIEPGGMFVHRNIANVVAPGDSNVLAVITYAVNVLKVKHIIVCGHYQCGGVLAAMQTRSAEQMDSWLWHIKDVEFRHAEALKRIGDEQKRYDRLCELNVVEQVRHVCHASMVQEAWGRGQGLWVHGWMLRLKDGLVIDLGVSACRPEDVEAVDRRVIADDE